MAITELDILLRRGWTAASLGAALQRGNTGDLRAVSLICEDKTCPQGDWEGIAGLLESRNQLRQVSIRIPSGYAEAARSIAEPLIGMCRRTGASLSVDIVIEASADAPAFLLGHGAALAPVMDATRELVSQGRHVRWLIPLGGQLVYRLDGVVSLAYDSGAEPVLLPPDAFGDAPPLPDAERLFAGDFVEYRSLGEDIAKLSPQKISYYRNLLHWLKEQPVSGSETATHILSAGPADPDTWDIHPLTGSNPALRTQALNHAVSDQRGLSGLAKAGNLAADISGVLGGGVLAHLQFSLTRLLQSRHESAPGDTEPTLKHALLIGAYGGEHIGDLAILGGVLRRIHQRHGTRSAVLMTQRPDHTRHLIPMLDSPVSLEVMEYSFANIRQSLAQADGVVFAGGPLTDIPKQLVRHLYAASLAKRAGKPFIVEGIGPGVLKRPPSMLTAKRLVSLADRISIRTSDDAQREVIQGLSFEIGRDPAFDYLETRADSLTRLHDGEEKQIDDLLNDTQDRILVGVNIRPIGDFFTPDAPGRDRAKYTREIEQNFEQQFAKGLQKFAEIPGKKPCFVFFPMNAIQFGMSDLRSAYRIIRHLDPGIDVRVWQADASLDAVVALIRRLDVAVTMRFHATIFSLSQGCKVIGVDYRIGKRDKVASVLSDAGKPDDFCRIDELTDKWLCEKLTAMTTQNPAEN